MVLLTDEALHMELSQFLADENTLPEDCLALAAFLKARQRYSKPTDYISDIEQRLEILKDIQLRSENVVGNGLDSTAPLWSALMVVPLERLKYLQDYYTSTDRFRGLLAILNMTASQVPILLKVFLAKNLSQVESNIAQRLQKRLHSSRNSRGSSIADKPNLEQSTRDQTEAEKCEQRDRCCVVTGAAHPDICHVFPFTAKKSPGQTAAGLAVYADLWGEQMFSRLEDLLVKEGNIIDTAKNMVALQPLLYRWWSKAIIGFEPIEEIENGIRLRFRWLHKTGLLMKDDVLLYTNPLTRLQLYSDQDGHIGIRHAKTGRPIVDGTVIDIVAQDESAIPSWDIFSLQWDLLRMASMCGAAEAIDEDDWESDDDDGDDVVDLATVARTTDFVHQARAFGSA